MNNHTSTVDESMKRAQDLITDISVGIPYVTYLSAVAANSHPPKLDWETAYENWSVSLDHGGGQYKIRESMATTLKAFDEHPEQGTANALYLSFTAHKLEFEVLLDSGKPSLKDELSLKDHTTQLLLEIATETPHRVVFVNAVCWLLAVGNDLDQSLINIACFEDALTDAIWLTFGPTDATTTVTLSPIVASLAKAGSYDAQLWLCDQLVHDPSDAIKSAALRFGFSNVTPVGADLFGEPNEHLPSAIVDFIKQTGLYAELQAEEIDDELAHAVIEILSEGICTCIVDGTELSFFKQTIPIEKILRLAIEHLQGRSLRLQDLFSLAWVYHVIFEEIDRWLRADIDTRLHENDLVIDRDKHCLLAQCIRDVYVTPENEETLRTAIEAGGVQCENAQMALDLINGTYSADAYYVSRKKR